MDDIKDDAPVKELADGSIVVGEETVANTSPENEAPSGDERLNAESESPADDEQGHSEETPEEAEARKERNRTRRAQNKENRKNYVESLKRELASRDELINELSTRVASVEQHSVGNQIAQVDAALQEAERYYVHFKEMNRKAIELADGAAAVDAQEKMFAAQQRYQMLQNAKKNMAQRGNQPKPLDPRMKQHATDWISKNAWYDPNGTDADSAMAISIDTRLVQEGWNPTTKEYWDELDARVKKYLPHRTVSGYNKPQSGSVPRVPVGGGSESSSVGATKGGYHLSAERVKALKEAGVYDDPVKRADMIRRYQQADRDAAAQSK